MIDAALSLWAFSIKEHRFQNASDKKFPCGSDKWIRGGLVKEETNLRILGPPATLLLRDLDWCLPNGLDEVLEAEMRQSPASPDGVSYRIKSERIGYSGEQWYASAPKKLAENISTRISDLDHREKGLSYWEFNPAKDIAHQTDRYSISDSESSGTESGSSGTGSESSNAYSDPGTNQDSLEDDDQGQEQTQR
ncbi:hypothetical protein IL306_007616, partial [Fusarium sp. DS 682]